MTNYELVTKLRQRFPDFERQEIEEVVQIILNEITNSLRKGRRIEIRNFGVISSRVILSRSYKVLRSGERVSAFPVRKIQFKSGKLLRNNVDYQKYPKS